MEFPSHDRGTTRPMHISVRLFGRPSEVLEVRAADIPRARKSMMAATIGILGSGAVGERLPLTSSQRVGRSRSSTTSVGSARAGWCRHLLPVPGWSRRSAPCRRRLLASAPATEAGGRVMFLSGDDKDAKAVVSALIDDIGYAPVWDSNPAWAATDSACTGLCQHRLPSCTSKRIACSLRLLPAASTAALRSRPKVVRCPLVTDSRCAAPYDDSRWRTSCENGFAERS